MEVRSMFTRSFVAALIAVVATAVAVAMSPPVDAHVSNGYVGTGSHASYVVKGVVATLDVEQLYSTVTDGEPGSKIRSDISLQSNNGSRVSVERTELWVNGKRIEVNSRQKRGSNWVQHWTKLRGPTCGRAHAVSYFSIRDKKKRLTHHKISTKPVKPYDC